MGPFCSTPTARGSEAQGAVRTGPVFPVFKGLPSADSSPSTLHPESPVAQCLVSKKGFPGTLPFSVLGRFYVPKTSCCCMWGSPWEADSEGEIETEGQTGNTGEEGQGDRGTEGGNSFPSPVSVSVTLDSHRPLPVPQWSPSRRGLRRSDCRGMTSRF